MWKSLTLTALLLGGALPAAHAAGAITADVIKVQPQPIQVYAPYPGTVVPSEYVQIASRMSGYVQNIKVDVGQSVKKDDLLLSVNPTDVNAGVEQARSQLAKARAALNTAKENYDRFKALYAQHAVSKQRFEQITLAYHAAQSDLQAAQAGMKKARNQVGYAKVRAPFDGIIFAKKVSNGQLVNPGQVLLVLYNPNRLEVDVEVGDGAYYRLKQGEKVPVEYSAPNQQQRRVEATAISLVAASDPTTHTHTVKLLLPADTDAQGGEYARVLVPVEQQSAVVVPDSAVHIRAGIDGVFVVDDAGNAQFRMVTLGEQRDGGRVVLSGLFPGDRLIVKAQGELVNGIKVQATNGGGA